MKKRPLIAIFHMENTTRLFMLRDGAKKAGFEPFVFHLRDIRFFVDDNGYDIKIGDVSLKDFSLIFVCGFWNFQAEVATIAEFCKTYNVPILDSALLRKQFISKTWDMQIFSKHNFPLIKTVSLESRQGSLELLLKEFSFPIVAKENRGKRGYDVHLLKNKNELENFLNKIFPEEKTLDTKTYQFQEFVPADFDIRVLVLGGRVLGAIERRSADPNEFRHNVSLGGHAKQIDISKEMADMAIAIAAALKYEFAGVDFITDKFTGKTYLLEVNRSPGFEGFMTATGIDVPYEVMKFFLRFAQNAIK